MSHLWESQGQDYTPTAVDFDIIFPRYPQSSSGTTQWNYPPRDPCSAPPPRYHPDAPPPRYHPDAPPRYHQDTPPPRYHSDAPPPRYHHDTPPRNPPEFEVSSPESHVEQEPSSIPSDTISTPETPYMTPLPQFSYSQYTPSLPDTCISRKASQLMVLELAKIEYHGHTPTVPYINPTVPTHRIPISVARSNRKFKCEYTCSQTKRTCKLAFGRKEHLRRHILTHTGVRAWKCHICNRKFSRSDNLGKHVLEIHEKKKGARHRSKPKSR